MAQQKGRAKRKARRTRGLRSDKPLTDEQVADQAANVIDAFHRMPSGLTARQEARLTARAARGRWGVSPEERKKAKTSVVAILRDRKATNRDKIQAVNSLLAMDDADAEADKLDNVLDPLHPPQGPGVMVGVNVNVPQRPSAPAPEGSEDDDAGDQSEAVAGTVAAILARLHGKPSDQGGGLPRGSN